MFDEQQLDGVLSALSREDTFSRRSFLRLFGGVTAGAIGAPALLAACGGSSPAPTAKSNQPVNLGVIYPVTGPLVASFAPLFVPLNLAVSEVNASGGIMGRQIKTVPFDDQGAAGQEPQVAQNILDQGITFVAGPVGSSQCLASVQVLQTRGSKVIQSPLGADPPLGEPSKYPGNFMLKETTNQDVDVMVRDYFTTHAKKVAIMYENTAYGQAATPYATQQLAAKKVTPTTTISFDPLASSYTTEIARVRATGADALFLITSNATSTIKLVTAMIQQEYTPYVEGDTVFLINVGTSLPQGVTLTSEFAGKIRVPVYKNFVWSPGKPVAKRVSDYCKKIIADPSVNSASRYSAVQGPYYDYVHILKVAIESAKSFDYAKVKRELENIHNYDGMIGKISFRSSDHHGVVTDSMTGGSPSDFTAPESLGFLPVRIG